ncbi:hypothetical protein AOQ84DRAFT_371356 [Glonium stellatum]|uniref:Ankyrin repeat protein n=1 Tax=Glonium stellatum TaxID=574774 RepID=A0A8E2FBX1_9PEZI|nr:hypothetical protein AOQ84DRAFT_371356 [Glonium stellatum]
MKTLPKDLGNFDNYSGVILWSIEFAIDIELRTGELQFDYLNEVIKLYALRYKDPPNESNSTHQVFLQVAVLLSLHSYVEATIAQSRAAGANVDLNALLVSVFDGEHFYISPRNLGLLQQPNLSRLSLPNLRIVRLLLEHGADPKVLKKFNLPPEINGLCQEYARKNKWWHRRKRLFKHRN